MAARACSSPELVLVLPEDDRLAAAASLPMPQRWIPAAYEVAAPVARKGVELATVLWYTADRLLATMLWNVAIALAIAMLALLLSLNY
jgi:hypothetical protein